MKLPFAGAKDQRVFHKRLFRDNLPYGFFVADGVILQKYGNVIQTSYMYRGPDLDAVSSQVFAAQAAKFNSAIMRLGDGWAVYTEAQRFIVKSYQGATFDYLPAFLFDHERKQRFQSGARHYDTSYFITFTFCLPGAVSSGLKNLAMTADNSSDLDEYLREFQDFVDVCESIMALLGDTCYVRRLTNDETLSYLKTNTSMNWHWVRSPYQGTHLDYLLADQGVEQSEVLKIGDHWCPIAAIYDFPPETYPGIMDRLNRIDAEFRLVHRFINLSKKTGLKHIEQSIKGWNGSRLNMMQTFAKNNGSASDNMRENTGSISKMLEAEEAFKEVDTDNCSIGYWNTSVMVWDKDLDVATTKLARIMNEVNLCSFTCKKEDANAYMAFMGMMAGNVFANVREYVITTSNFAHIVPLTAMWSGHHDGGYIGKRTETKRPRGIPSAPHLICATNQATPFCFNLSADGDDVGHTAILGPTGSGKSVLLATLAIQWMKYPGARVISFDVDNSIRGLTHIMGGQYNWPGMRPCEFSPFIHLEDSEDFNFAFDFLLTILKANDVPITPDMRTAITTVLDYLKNMEVADRNFDSILYLDEHETIGADGSSARPLFDVLRRYAGSGPYAGYFNSTKEFNIDEHWVMFEMGKLMESGPALMAPAVVYIMHQVNRLVRRNPRPTLFLWDEAFKALQFSELANSMATVLRTFRKFDCFLVFATQSLHEVLSSSIGPVIIQNCPTKIFLADQEATTPANADLYHRAGLSADEIHLLSIAQKKRDYLYTSKDGTRLFGLDYEKGCLQLALIDTREKDGLPPIDTIEAEPDVNKRLMMVLERNGYDVERLAYLRDYLEGAGELSTLDMYV